MPPAPTEPRSAPRRRRPLLLLLLGVAAIAGGSPWWRRTIAHGDPSPANTTSPNDASPGGAADSPTPDPKDAGDHSADAERETPTERRRPTLPTDEPRFAPNGDRLVVGLDGLELRQPKDSAASFGIFRPGERNELGLPTGVLPDGRWVFYNVPTTVTREGRSVESLNRYLARPDEGPVLDPETGHEARVAPGRRDG